MKIVKTILNAVSLTNSSATDGNPTEIDMATYSGIGREFIISGKIVEGATAPGTSKTLTVNYYWSDEKLSAPTDAPTVCASRKTACSAFTRANSAGAVRQFAAMTTPIRPLARYLYVTVDRTATDAGNTATLTLNLVRVPSQSVDF